MIDMIIKKSIITVFILSLAGNVLAGDKKSSTTASAGSVALASLATMAGGACVTIGAIGIQAQMDASYIRQVLPPSVSSQLLSTDPSGLLIIPGIILGVGAALYTFKSANGIWAKIRATLGSSALLAGGVFLALGCVGYAGNMAYTSMGCADAGWYMWHDGIKRPSYNAINSFLALSGTVALGGAALSLIGYALQPVNKSK